MSTALHLLNTPRVQFPTSPEQYAAHPVPSLDEWHAMWTAWDTVTRDMLPDDELLEKPIKLRNACIFYLGHIPAFLDIHLTRATAGKPTNPPHYHAMFERGIDPDVDDPEKCHSHSEIPDEWPPLDDMLKYQDQVRKRVLELYNSGLVNSSKKVARAMWLALEHEIMHLETLLYMLIQSERTLPPPGTIKPDFEALAKQAAAEAVPNQWFNIPAQNITIGINDPDDNSGPSHFFGWDNEKPARKADVGAFSITARPITNGEYAAFLESSGREGFPASWSVSNATTNGTTNGHANGHANGHVNGGQNGHTNGHTNGQANGDHVEYNDSPIQPSTQCLHGKSVRTVYGSVPLALALDWPVSASYDELSACAGWMGGRIPTLEETRSAYEYAEVIRGRKANQARAENIPAVNGHLSNDGVQETPPATKAINGLAEPNPRDFFIDLKGKNTGFKHWHPMPVTARGNQLGGQCDMGGLWEWTSTAFHQHAGFEPMELYPLYSADFFDGKHNIVLGGSWATGPRVAGRKSL